MRFLSSGGRLELKNKNIAITGGAGFIGNKLIKKLLKDNNIFIYDNLSTGNFDNVKPFLGKDNFYFEEGDLLDKNSLNEFLDPGIDLVFHLAANPDVKIGANNTNPHYNDLKSSKNLLDSMKNNNIQNIAFTSSSVVYGPANLPTPEDHQTKPISIYGASKLSIESFISAYSHTFDLNSWIFRLANIIGKKGHGVIIDFIEKLEKDPSKLEILGDGSQEKSYLLVDECIEAMKFVIENDSRKETKIYNIGSKDLVSVKEIAEVVIEEMNLYPRNVELEYTGGINGRGWKGDVKKMLLDISKLEDLGWKGKSNSKEAVRATAKSIIKDKKV